MKSRNAWTPLMYAACYGSAETVEMLIRAGSDLNAKDGNCGGQTVLIWAARSGKQPWRKVRALLQAGADPKLTSESGWTPLMAAARGGELTTVELLLAHGAPARAKTQDDQTAADIARKDHPEIARLLDDAAAKE